MTILLANHGHGRHWCGTALRELRESIGTGSTQKRREDFKSKRLDEFLPLGVFQTQRGIINAARNDFDFSTRKNKEQSAGGESLFTLIFFFSASPRLVLSSCLLSRRETKKKRKENIQKRKS
jgi:hypothetical protein